MNNLTEYDQEYMDKILDGESIESFRFFAECRRVVYGLSIFGPCSDVRECHFENPEYGKVDIVPDDYPAHAKRRTYISDVESMFKPNFEGRCIFIRKTAPSQHIEKVTYREWITPYVYVNHEVEEVVD